MTEPRPSPRALSHAQREMVIQRLKAKGAPRVCPSCAHGSWQIGTGLTHLTLSGSVAEVGFGGPAIPAAVLICNICGYIALHSLGILGLINDADFDAAGDP